MSVDNCFPLENISLLRIAFSIEIFPGPMMTSDKHIAIRSSSNSYPPINPLDNLTVSIAPSISIISSTEAILVRIPSKIAKPPINSRCAIGTNNSGVNLQIERNRIPPRHRKILVLHLQ